MNVYQILRDALHAHAFSVKEDTPKEKRAKDSGENSLTPSEADLLRMRALIGENRTITGEYDPTLSVKCENGTFVGRKQEAVISFKGIPFALPPVGERRWKPPVSVSPGGGVYEAFYFGPSPIQTEWFSELASCYKKSEDCLYLNIWKNTADATPDKAVMVFIHGGSYGWGGTSDPIYDGFNFIRAHSDVILVTIAYRTGIAGFVDFSEVPGGENYQESGNLGLLDQIEALRWIRRNIRGFGGDPERVTVFGESAGGGSVSLLPLIPAAKGLFRRVIAESGSVALSYNHEDARNFTAKLLQAAHASTVEDLLKLSEAEFAKVNEAVNFYNNFPLRDGIVLPEDPYAAYRAGAGEEIDMLFGTNADESNYWIRELGGEKIFRSAIPVMFESNLKKISEEDAYLVEAFMKLQKKEYTWKMTEFYTELLFRIPAVSTAASHADHGGKTYMYYWTYPSAIGRLGACHAVELAYVFNNLDETLYTGDNIDAELAKKVQDMWVNFAKTGDPSILGYEWPEYDHAERKTMFLGSEMKVVSDPLRGQRTLMEPLLHYYFNGCYSNLDYNVTYVRATGLTIILGLGLLAGLVLLVLKLLHVI